MYNIEKAIRKNSKGEEKEVRFFSGVGNLTSDVEVRKVKRKDNNEEISVVGNFGLSMGFNYYENGEKKAVFYPIEAWGITAESLGKVGKKGVELSVVGRLEKRTYTNPTKNVTYENDVLVIERFQVTSRGWKGEEEYAGYNNEKAVAVEGFEQVEDSEEIPF